MEQSSISRRDFFKLLGGITGVAAFSYLLGLRDQPPAAPNMSNLDFIETDISMPVFRGPFLQKDAQLAAFLFHANINSLAEICDQTLNRVPGSPYRYIPFTPNLVVLYADTFVSSLDEQDSRIGLISETEVGFWVPVVALQKNSTAQIPHHLAWFIPNLFVDESNSIATGREVYGFNKQAAIFEKIKNPQAPQFSAEVLGFQNFGPDVVAKKEPLLSVTTPVSAEEQVQWSNWETAQKELSNTLLSQTPNDPGEEIVQFAARTILQNMPVVFLKQFRHASDPRKACYQSIVDAPMELKSFTGGGFLGERARMQIHPLASHPITQRLGLKEEQQAISGAWAKLSFTLGLGVEHNASNP